MIELIFAIVIIAIGVMSLPMVSSVTAQGSANNLQYDEAIFEAYVRAMEVVSGDYDTITPAAVNTSMDATTNGVRLYGLKYENKVDLSIDSNSSFLGKGAAQGYGVKKITVSVKNPDGDLLTKLTVFKFNIGN
jgi:type II secretory pathway pseudopilin PulG